MRLWEVSPSVMCGAARRKLELPDIGLALLINARDICMPR